MLFPSNIFLFCFFPIVLFFYYIVFRKSMTCKNVLLFLSSLIFYAYGEGKLVILLLLSILMNYGFGYALLKNDEKETVKKVVVFFAVVLNLSFLFYYKYLDFTIENINRLFHTEIKPFRNVLPIGISFYTFQALSYVIDVYRKKAPAQKNPYKVGLYISLFPQLVAGPIVRYDKVADQIDHRKESLALFSDGIYRFVCGLGKKVLLADTMSLFADRILKNMELGGSASVLMAWFGTICYTLRIYYDFAGYSDMAIGLGKMFGFTFEENFNYPYIAKSITDFWRRWHISMSTWFRDYIYIPLGGSRKGPVRAIFNMFMVWLLTGLWHGAGWNYVAWGLFNFVLLFLEKQTKFFEKIEKTKVSGHIYLLFLQFISMTIFMCPSLSMIGTYLGTMFGIGAEGFVGSELLFLLKDNWVMIVLSILFVMPVGKKVEKYKILKEVFLCVVLIVSLIYIEKGNYSPFIYFNF